MPGGPICCVVPESNPAPYFAAHVPFGTKGLKLQWCRENYLHLEYCFGSYDTVQSCRFLQSTENDLLDSIY